MAVSDRSPGAEPSEGGAIRGIDEKFRVNPSNGTVSLTVPLPFTKARNGFVPPLGLGYNSGSGNGVAGLGCSLDLPVIRRRTDHQLPQYRDRDVFLLTGSEDLVPASVWSVDHRDPDQTHFGNVVAHRHSG